MKPNIIIITDTAIREHVQFCRVREKIRNKVKITPIFGQYMALFTDKVDIWFYTLSSCFTFSALPRQNTVAYYFSGWNDTPYRNIEYNYNRWRQMDEISRDVPENAVTLYCDEELDCFIEDIINGKTEF